MKRRRSVQKRENAYCKRNIRRIVFTYIDTRSEREQVRAAGKKNCTTFSISAVQLFEIWSKVYIHGTVQPKKQPKSNLYTPELKRCKWGGGGNSTTPVCFKTGIPDTRKLFVLLLYNNHRGALYQFLRFFESKIVIGGTL